ncbi:hypothetical protein [Streptomyces sp. NBC_01751]|uniref:hypothetical protein n=1 Tax=Streptomyces sp. NBC_01751 TaxID=2975929 RepID=UPI002DD7AABB|nr:hypothetical protein [Streptomyces sp. NBC_01751]WSD24572.1 hypothetical protein OHA26_14355 [Streptomyces sp. NBC_01751]
MSDWFERYNGLSQLGREHTPDYRGYVVRVDSEPNPEKWFTYAFDQDDQHTYWLGMSDTEAEAKAVLERLLVHGWVCEVFENSQAGHCKDQAVKVKHIWHERGQERLRSLLCERHGDVFSDWAQMTIPAYIRTYNGLEQDAAFIGKRL